MRFGIAAQAALGIDQHHDDVGILGAAPGGSHHRLVEPAARLEDAGRIDKDDLRLRHGWQCRARWRAWSAPCG